MKNREKNGLREIYTYYKSLLKKYERVLSYDVFSNLLRDFNKELARMMIEEGVEFKMPNRLGSLRLRKYKSRLRFNEDGSIDKSKLPVDWGKTRKLWMEEYPDIDPKDWKKIKDKPLVYHLNEHTDGYRILVYWNKKGSNADNRSVYSFVFTSVNNRHLGRVLKGDKKPEYYE